MGADFRRFIAEVRRNPFLSVSVIAIILLMASVSLLPAYRGRLFDIEPQKAGEFGDFIGGFVGPILSLLGIVFVVLTLRDQRESNVAEREAENLEAFENRFYELIRIHRKNVSEMRLDDEYKGRASFAWILVEVQVAVIEISNTNARLSRPLTDFYQLQLAYYFTFFGDSSNAAESIKAAMRISGCDISASDFDVIATAVSSAKHGYKGPEMFWGHQQDLGHYYRHLFQLVCYIDGQALSIDKYQYVKTVRAQLSTQEQMLLLLNSFTHLGHPWWNRDFIIRYKLVKNIPKNSIEQYFFIKVDSVFPEEYFEWEQPSVRPDVLHAIQFLNPNIGAAQNPNRKLSRKKPIRQRKYRIT